MVNELRQSDEDKTTKILLEGYKQLAFFVQTIPGVSAIASYYSTHAENELFQHIAVHYGSDFYDGSEENNQNFLPDSMHSDTFEELGIKQELLPEEISAILSELQYCFILEGKCINSPLQEVW